MAELREAMSANTNLMNFTTLCSALLCFTAYTQTRMAAQGYAGSGCPSSGSNSPPPPSSLLGFSHHSLLCITFLFLSICLSFFFDRGHLLLSLTLSHLLDQLQSVLNSLSTQGLTILSPFTHFL